MTHHNDHGTDHTAHSTGSNTGADRNINDQLKDKIDQLDLDSKLGQAQETAQKALAQIKERAGALLQDNRGKVDEFIDKATATIDEKTEGKYHDKVEKARASFASGLDKLQDGAETTGSGAASGAPTSGEAANPFDLGGEYSATGHVGSDGTPGTADSEWVEVDQTGDSSPQG